MINRQTAKFIYCSRCRRHNLSTSVGWWFCFVYAKVSKCNYRLLICASCIFNMSTSCWEWRWSSWGKPACSHCQIYNNSVWARSYFYPIAACSTVLDAKSKFSLNCISLFGLPFIILISSAISSTALLKFLEVYDATFDCNVRIENFHWTCGNWAGDILSLTLAITAIEF